MASIFCAWSSCSSSDWRRAISSRSSRLACSERVKGGALQVVDVGACAHPLDDFAGLVTARDGARQVPAVGAVARPAQTHIRLMDIARGH